MPEERKLRKSLGVFDVTAIVSGIIIGAGVFAITGFAAKYAGALTWVSYVIGAIPVTLAGISTVALNLFYPVEGGESYVYPTRLVSKFFGFLSGWGMWLAILGPVAITAFVFVLYTNMLPGLPFQFPIIGLALLVCAVFFFINWAGVKTASVIQNILFIIMVAGLAIYVVVGLFHINMDYVTMGSPGGWGGVMKGASMLIFAYGGLTLAADLGEEAKEPVAHTISLGIILGIIIPALLYASSAFVSTAVVPWDEFAASSAPYALVAEKMGIGGLVFIVIVAWAALLTSHNGEQVVASRIMFGLSRDKIITGKLTWINKHGIPGFALITTVLIAAFLIVFIALSGTLEVIADGIVTLFLYNWILTHIAVLMEPIKYPELYEKCRMHISRGWKAIIPIAGIIASVVVLPFLGWQALVFGAIIFGIGAVVYCIGYGRNRSEVDKLIGEWPRERYFKI